MSVADELFKLKELHEQGILTDDEFTQQKEKILSSDIYYNNEQRTVICNILGKDVDLTDLQKLLDDGKYYQLFVHAMALDDGNYVKHNIKPINCLIRYIDQHQTIPSAITPEMIAVTPHGTNIDIIRRWREWERDPDSISRNNTPRCPKCGSTSVTTTARGVNFTWGLAGASKTVNRCGNCGHTWKPRG